MKVLSCGHDCLGVCDESRCMPCLHEGCPERPLYITQCPDDFCAICQVEPLRNAPCVFLDCGHVFHYNCVANRLKETWPTPQITFGFLKCPLCKMRMSSPEISTLIHDMQVLYQDLEQRAYEQLSEECMMKDEELTLPEGEYYQNP